MSIEYRVADPGDAGKLLEYTSIVGKETDYLSFGADAFNISIYTVISHRRNISQKLGINSIPGLTVYAIMNKLVDMSDFS